jgi:hypothetical protein
MAAGEVGLKAVLGAEGLLAEGADLAARPVVVGLEVLLHVAGVETDLLTDAAAHLTCSRSEKGGRCSWFRHNFDELLK